MLYLLLLPYRLVTNFTFGDAADFLPLLTLVVGLTGTVLVHRSRQKQASPPLIALLLMLSSWPILPQVGLFFLARELQAVHGSWPQVMVDDPKNWFGHVSPLYDALFDVVDYLLAFAAVWMVVSVALFFTIRSRLSVTQRRVFISTACLALLVAIVDPGNLYAWWMD